MFVNFFFACCFATFVTFLDERMKYSKEKRGFVEFMKTKSMEKRKERMNNRGINLAHNNTQKTERMESESSH